MNNNLQLGSSENNARNVDKGCFSTELNFTPKNAAGQTDFHQPWLESKSDEAGSASSIVSIPKSCLMHNVKEKALFDDRGRLHVLL